MQTKDNVGGIIVRGRIVYHWRRRKNTGIVARDRWRHMWSFTRSCPQSGAFPVAIAAWFGACRMDYMHHKQNLSVSQRRNNVRGFRRVRLAS